MDEPLKALVPLELILRTNDLRERSRRPPDYETENRALASLVRALTESPRTILQALTDKTLEALAAGSRGSASLRKMVNDSTGLPLLACGHLIAAAARLEILVHAAMCSTAMCRYCSLIGNVATLIWLRRHR